MFSQKLLFSFIFIFQVQACLQKPQSKTFVNKKIIQTIDDEFIRNCETAKATCKSIIINRNDIKDSILFVFPFGGTQTDVYLYQTSMTEFIKHDRKFTGEGNTKLDLTGLQDGNYKASMLVCSMGATFAVTIQTR